MDELEDKVVKLCGEYLSGPWTDSSNVKVRKLTQGFGNRNFHCSLTPEVESNDHPSNVVVHIYGSVLTGNESTIKLNGEAAEALVVNTLNGIGMAPKLLGVFPGGRIEEYIPSTNCSSEDFANPVVNKLLARKLAFIHSLNMPIPKLSNKVEQFKKLLTTLVETAGKTLEGAKFDVFKEFDWYQNIITQISGRTVFNHGDTNPNNILVLRDESNNVKDVMFIDYEICTYFYRSADIANLFITRNMQVENIDGMPKITLADEELRKISETLEKQFLEEYLQEWKLLRGGQDDAQDSLEQLEMEVDFSRLFINAFLLSFMENMSDKIDPSCQKDGKNLEGENCDVFKEFDWYQSIITQISGQTVFNHGDTNPNNILVIRDESNNVKDVMFIDYEICCYFYRSTDIANIFIARHMKFENVDGKLKITMAGEEFRKVSYTLEKEFLEEYLKEWKLLRSGEEDPQDCLEQLEMEVDFSRLFLDAYFISFIENLSDKIDPSCQKYVGIADYDNRKQRIMEKYASKLESLAHQQSVSY